MKEELEARESERFEEDIKEKKPASHPAVSREAAAHQEERRSVPPLTTLANVKIEPTPKQAAEDRKQHYADQEEPEP